MPQRDWERHGDMITVDEAFDRILSAFQPLPAVECDIVDAVDLVLASDIVAHEDIPPFQNSAMDGYAVRSSDLREASPESPVELNIVGVIPAGTAPSLVVKLGEAARIMTGAPIPDGADTVVRFEETDELERRVDRSDASKIGIHRAAHPHENVRDRGEDIPRGAPILTRGRRLRPSDVGILATLNLSNVEVHRRPRVGVLATGDEVVDIGPELEAGQIRNSNSYTIAALARRAGADPVLLGIAGDHVEALRESLQTIDDLDMIVTSGGVSLGDYDMVKDVLAADGQIDIWQVRMKPGKPLAFGTIRGIPLLGLPGNPAAALVSFEQFGRPAIRKMLGWTDVRMPERRATLTESIKNTGRRRHFVHGTASVRHGKVTVCSTGIRGAAMLSALIEANCFIIIPETESMMPAGSDVTIQLFDDQLAVEFGLSDIG